MHQLPKFKTPLIIENHPENYNGYKFITLIQYSVIDEPFLSIIDNVTSNKIYLYDLDSCVQENLDEDLIITEALNWYKNYKDKLPFSIYLSSRNLSGITGTIYKSFNVEYITRFIGPLHCYNVNEPYNIKRKKFKKMPDSMVLDYVTY